MNNSAPARRGPRSRRSRVARVGLRMGLLLVAAVLLTACGSQPQSALDPQGPFAQQPHDLLQIVFWIAVAIFVIVQGLIVYTMIRFRDRGDDDSLPAQVHGNTKLEIFWTVVPALILAGIAVPTVQTIFELDAEVPESLQVEVIGHRWWFEYRYPTQPGVESEIVTANELVIPTGQSVRLNMTAKDPGDSDQLAVIHSFWVPKLAGKQDVVPGRTTTLNLQAEEPGRYLGACAEYCGLSHANMRVRVEAMEPAAFEQWLADQQQPATEPEPGSLEAQGRDLLTSEEAGGQACASCHAVGGLDNVNGRIGPDLTHLMSRKQFAGAILDLYERDSDGDFTDEPNLDELKQWLRDPNSLKPMQPGFGVGMPDLELTEEEIDALAAYLVTLK